MNRLRQWGHMLLFYSFAGLAVVTTWAIAYLYGWEFLGIQAFGPFHFGEAPYPLSDPMKILALVSSIAFALGIVIILLNRFGQAGKAGLGSYFDWIFLAIVVGVGATGMASWVLRLADMEVGYLVYFFTSSSSGPCSPMRPTPSSRICSIAPRPWSSPGTPAVR